MFGRRDIHDGKAIVSACDFEPSAEQQQVIDAFLAMRQAMVSADHDALRALVEDPLKALAQRSRLLATNVPGGTFAWRSKHMSGAVQTKEEFISEVGGPLTYYHSDTQVERVTVDGDWATLEGVTALTACAYGARGTFPIRSAQVFHRVGGRWLRSHRS